MPSGNYLLTLADNLDDPCPRIFKVDPERLQDTSGKTLLLPQQAEQNVLGADVVVPERPRLLLGENDHLTRPVREPLDCPAPRSRVDR